MEYRIGKTQDGVKKYPLHKHGYYEIMYYVDGVGHLQTKTGAYPFSKDTVIIVPPSIEHGSVSENGFKNISLGGAFEHFFSFTEPIVLKDTVGSEGETLANLIYNNRYRQDGYLTGLVSAYLYFLLRHIRVNKDSEKVVKDIVSDISNRFLDSELDLATLLRNSGYAEDYARALFKKVIGKTPNGFLTDLRIKHACFLIDVYAGSLPMTKIAEQCGYTDYIYFSKKFKEVTGLSPMQYKTKLHA